MQRYPAAELLAQQVILGAEDTIDEALKTWGSEYVARVGAQPSVEEIDAARTQLDARLQGTPPPLPPSASSSAWKLPSLEIGLPKDIL